MQRYLCALVLCFGLGASAANAQAPAEASYVYVDDGWGWFEVPIVVVPVYGFAYLFNASFGAIAYSPETGKYGVSWGHPSRYKAQKAARNFCGHWSCEPVVWVQGGCAALAVSNDPFGLNWVGWSYQPTLVAAQQQSLYGCALAGGTNCQGLAWTCSF